ncbi:MAG: VCBS repeat-containing protein, partial [Microcystis sp. M046S2]
ALSKGDGSFNFIHQPQGLTALFWGNENNSEQLIKDFNGDEKDDIISLQSDGNNWVALSKGDGSFNFIHQPQGLTALFWGNENNSEQLIGDFNGDSSSDIVNLQSDGNNWLTLSNIKKNTEEKAINNLQSLRLETAYLTLQAQQNPDKLQSYLTEYQFNQLTPNNTNQAPPVQKLADNNLIGDFNNDKINDTYHHWNVSGANELYLGNSNGTFTKYVNPIATTAINESPTNVFTGDFNGDGKTDLYFYWKASGRNRLYISNGNGTFTQYLDPIGALAINGSPDNTFIADFNGDGKQDAYFHWKSSGTNRLYISNGNGTFTQYLDPITATVINGSLDNAFIADFNGDGKQDAYFYWKSSGTNRLYISNGNGTFTQYLDPITTTLINGSPDQVQVNDFNNDGKIDIRFQWTSSNTIRTFLNTGNSTFSQSLSAQELLNKYYPELNNPTTLATLQQQISDQQTQTQQQIDQLKNSISQKQAEAAASISQADWYQEKSAFYWEQSRKQGPTWTEWRSYKKRGLFKSKTEWTAITHVDHNWIIWDTYTKQATALRQHADQLLKGVQTDTLNKDTTTTILDQWNKANTVANEAALSQTEFIHLLQQLEAERKLSEDKIAQINDWEKLLPILQTQLQQATQDAATATTNTQKETSEYQTSKDNYLNALNSVLQKRAELQTQTQLLQQDITAAKNWAIQQTTYLADELSQSQTLITQLQSQRQTIAQQLTTATGDNKDTLLTQQAQLDQSIQLLTQKQTVLTAQQATLTQKQTLLSTQEQVLLTQYQLLDATLASPDKDTSTLEKQLADTRKTLAEVQKLAEQAEASSQALTAAMDGLQASLLLQNDKYLAAIKDKQQAFKNLIDATELEKNYTLQATTKRQELNSIESQLITILKQANDAGSKEAAQLLEVANANNMATAAELYYKDYRDLASDKGGGCSGGIARPEDLLLADKYYAQMQEYRQLQQQAQQQVSQFTALRQAAESQITLLDGQKALATQELAQLQQSIGNSQEAIEAHKQEIAVAEFRIDALSQLKDWTNQTLLQVLSVEKFNLAQAQLEQEIAEKRGQLIDDAVAAQLEKQRLDIQRDRQIAVTKLEQLNQLNTEEALQQAINNLRTDLGINPIENIITQADYKGQLAGILADLDALKQKQPNLPSELQSILTATRQDINAALQGKEAATIQDNLLKTVDGLIEQNNKLNAEITKLDQEEQQYLGILKQSETDLKGASKALYDEIQKTGVLDQEKTLLNQQNLEILYKIGYAQGAVELSDDLARQSQQLLSQIIEGRVKEREIRKKAFVNEVLGTAALIISTIAVVMTAGASLAAGTLVQTALSTTLSAVSASLSAVQAAYNGDWQGAIFNAGMAVISAYTADLQFSKEAIRASETLSQTEQLAQIAKLGLDDGIQYYQNINTVASGLYYGYKAIESGDNLTGLLNLFNAAIPVSGLSEYSYLSQAALSVNSGVHLAEEDNWLAATSSFLNAAVTLGKNLDFIANNTLASEVTDILRSVELSVNLVAGINTIADDGSLEGWLQGIQQIANGAINYSKYELPKTSPIELESIDQETIKQLAIKITANSPNSESLNVKEVEEVLSGIIQRIKNFDFTKMSSSNFTKEELQQTFLSWIIFNPKVTAQQLIETSKLTIQKFQTQEEIKEHNYFKDKYPNYESFSAHQDARAILHFFTSIPVEEISKHQAGLGITGIEKYGFNWEATYSDKWRQRTAFHDVTSTLDLKFNEESNQTNIKVPSFNKSVFGIESIVLSAITGVGIPGTIEEIFDFDLEVTTFLVDILFQLAIKPITWTTTQIDPLIVDLDNNGIKVTNLDNSLIRFDIDADGYSENVSWTNDGLLTVDLNHDGKINNITEIFSEYFKDGSANSGLEALKTYDTNNNGIISSTDTQFNQILVWQDLNQDGISQPNELKTLAQHNITSINLNAIASESIQDGNIIKKRSFFNRADGTGGEISDVAFLVTQTGFKVIQTATGIQIVAENDQAASLLIHKQTTPLNLNIATANVQVASGNTGNDTLYTTDTRNVFLSGEAGNDKLTGNSGNDWLIGGEGADQIIAGAGDDLLYIDAQDTKIDGGDGTDIAIVTTPNGITLDLGTTKLEMALGNDGNDTFTNSSAFSVTIDGGKGDDSIQGGTGKGEIDTFTGGIGRDTFILGDKTWIGYDDGNITSAGDNDYALITDFNLTDDIIQLNGSSSDYLLTVSGANTNLYINKPGNEPDELIAIINNNKALSLTASYFSYVSDTIFHTPVEAVGNTKLVKDTTNKLYTQIGNNNPIAINISGTQITTNIYPGWQTLAAETVNGVNQVLWKYNDGNYLHLWSLDSNWNWQSSTGWWGLNSSEAFTQETNFQQDFNGDGFIGQPYTPIEAFGNTKLVKDTTNKLYTQIGNNNPIAINISGTQITTNIYPGWQTLASETVNGVNQVLWKYNDGNYLHLWSLDNNWNWQSSTGWWGLNSSEAFTQETNFQQDFNGDNQIGNPLPNIASSLAVSANVPEPIIGSSNDDIITGTADNNILIGGLG